MSATLFLAALAVAQPATVWEPVKFELKSGTKLTYATTSTSTTDAMGQTFNSSFKQTKTIEAGVAADGWTLVTTKVVENSVQTDMDFGETPDPTGLVTSVLVSPTRAQKDMKVVESGKMTSDQVAILTSRTKEDMESGFEGLFLPAGDVQVGTTWTHEHAPAGVGMAGMRATTNGKLKTTFTVLEVKGSGADRTIVIESKSAGAFKMSLETPDGGAFDLDVKLEDTGKFTVRGADGAILKIELNSTQNMSSEFGEFVTKTKTTTDLKQ